MSVRLGLEIASNSVASALAAQAGGADRIELFDNLAEGGTTPSFASIAIARDRLTIPLFVLVRPRAGDFHYDALETELMLRDIAQCRALAWWSARWRRRVTSPCRCAASWSGPPGRCRSRSIALSMRPAICPRRWSR